MTLKVFSWRSHRPRSWLSCLTSVLPVPSLGPVVNLAIAFNRSRDPVRAVGFAMEPEYAALTAALVRHLGPFHSDGSPWSLGASGFGGRGLFASRDISTDEVIFEDRPIIVGPRAGRDEQVTCVVCHEHVPRSEMCPGGCGLPVCHASAACAQDETHARECKLLASWQPLKTATVSDNVLRALTSVRSLLLAPDPLALLNSLQANHCHQTETEINRAVAEFGNFPHDQPEILRQLFATSAVLNTNAFETKLVSEYEDRKSLRGSGRGLYPLACMMNHQCIPNVRYCFDAKHTMRVQATKPIRRGEEIFTSYIQIFWGTYSRRVHLAATKDFMCSCSRCADPTEGGAYLSALKCPKDSCEGRLLPLQPLVLGSSWSCDVCSTEMNNKKVSRVQDVLSALIITKIRKSDPRIVLDFLKTCINNIMPDSNQFIVELKLFVIWNLGNDGKHDYTLEEFQAKEKFCLELMGLLEQMGAGECTIKALIYFELYKCREQLVKLQRQEDEEQEAKYRVLNRKLLDRSWSMLKWSVGAPPELRQLMQRICAAECEDREKSSLNGSHH
ncbi:SET domain-containing protein SmydA-8 [Phlebotomus argentipes]|uniref:SET domain-containing protein SmydA-8 n=1 Tax=Phlebotomus argentipes TaxID=94469 RepID=UPI002892A7AA|nr:SET domain-containing protein SmydA-8 [Phlebotomus argentipes]